MKEIYVTALKEAVILREKAKASVSGLVKEIAKKKRDQLENIIEEKKPYKNRGFEFVSVSYEVSDWGNNAFSLTANFILRDTNHLDDITKKEAALLKEYSKIVEDIDWSRRWQLREVFEEAEKIDRKIAGLKNGIKITKSIYFNYSITDVLSVNVFDRGFNFN
jgi:hypothetical protein